MKKIILLFVLFAFAFGFYGCPYFSKVAIDEPAIKVEKKFLGNWKFKDGKIYYIVSKMDDYHLRIVQPPAESKEGDANKTGDSTIYIGHVSRIKDVDFLNISQLTKGIDLEGSGYYLYKLTVKGKDEISLSEVTGYIKEQFPSSEKLKAYIEKYMDLSFFFGAESIYIRE
jgi:hypothetical protein